MAYVPPACEPVKRELPGTMPCIRRPPYMMAVTALPGMPSVKSGIIAPPQAELFAASDAVIPSSAPCPNFSGVFENFFARL